MPEIYKGRSPSLGQGLITLGAGRRTCMLCMSRERGDELGEVWGEAGMVELPW